MAFKKGQSGNPNGRKKGVGNKTTEEFKTKLNDLLEQSAPKMAKWLEEIAAESPEKAFDILSKFAEYVHPKLARTEVKQETRLVDKEGKDIHTIDREILTNLGVSLGEQDDRTTH